MMTQSRGAVVTTRQALAVQQAGPGSYTATIPPDHCYGKGMYTSVRDGSTVVVPYILQMLMAASKSRWCNAPSRNISQQSWAVWINLTRSIYTLLSCVTRWQELLRSPYRTRSSARPLRRCDSTCSKTAKSASQVSLRKSSINGAESTVPRAALIHEAMRTFSNKPALRTRPVPACLRPRLHWTSPG